MQTVAYHFINDSHVVSARKKNAIYVCIIAEKVNKQKNYPDE